MKTTKKLTLVMAVAAMCAFAPLAARAADPAAAAPAVQQTFGVVDMNKVMQTTDVAKDVFSQLESKRKEYQTNIAKEEGALRSAEQEILKQKDSLSKDDFDKKRKEFEDKVISGQKLVQERKQILDHAFNSSMGKLRAEAAKIVADIAKEKSYSAVFTQDAVMISTPSLDMTDEVIARMNKSVKKMSVDWSSSDDASAKGGRKR